MSTPASLKVVFYDPSGHGGICHYTHQLAEALARHGNDVTVLTTESYELKHLERSFKLYIPFTKSWLKSWLGKVIARARGGGSHRADPSPGLSAAGGAGPQANTIISTLRRVRLWGARLKALTFFLIQRPCVIHFQWLVDRKEDYHFIRVLKLLGFKVIYTAHDLLPHDRDSPDNRKAFQNIYRAVDRVIVHAENSKKEIAEELNVDPDRVSVIPHGNSDLFYTRNAGMREAVRQELGIPGRKKVVLFFGLIKRYKGLEYLVDAFEEVRDTIEDAMLLVAGKVYDGDEEGFTYYSNLVARLARRDDVVCVNEYIPFEKIGGYFLASDVVVLPYVKTYTSGVLLAAYAAGRPVVVTATGALREVVEEGKSGFIVPPRDSHALAQAIIKIIHDPDQIERMGSYAKCLAETTYSWDKVAVQTLEAYRGVLNRYAT